MMRVMAPWIMLAAAFLMLAAAVLAALAVVQRYRGRHLSRSLIRAGAAMFGAGAGVFVIVFIREPTALLPLAVVVGFIAYDLLRRGQSVAAGILLLTVGLPSGLWWGRFLVLDALDPVIDYLPVLWLWWAPGPVLSLAAVALIARGDRQPPPARAFERLPDHVRDPAAIAHGIGDALAIGGVPVQVLVALGAAMTFILLTVPFALVAGLPWPVVLAAGTLGFAVIAAELCYFAIPTRVRRAWEGWSVIGNPEMKRWRATVKTPIPLGTAAVRRWLAAHPETDANRWARSELLVIAGQMAEARAVVGRLPSATDWERFERHAQESYIDWVEGRDPGLPQLQEEAGAIGGPDSQERRLAMAMVASTRARDRADRGEDWMAPLIEVRSAAGAAANGLLRADLRARTYPVMLIVGVPFCGITILLSGFLA